VERQRRVAQLLEARVEEVAVEMGLRSAVEHDSQCLVVEGPLKLPEKEGAHEMAVGSPRVLVEAGRKSLVGVVLLLSC